MLLVIKQHRFLLKIDVVLLPTTSIFTKIDVNINIQYWFLLKTDVVFIY